MYPSPLPFTDCKCPTARIHEHAIHYVLCPAHPTRAFLCAVPSPPYTCLTNTCPPALTILLITPSSLHTYTTRGVALTLLGVALTLLGVALTLLGVVLTLLGVALTLLGVALTLLGVALTLLGVALTLLGVAHTLSYIELLTSSLSLSLTYHDRHRHTRPAP